MNTKTQHVLTKAQLQALRDEAYHILNKLITPEGIFASTEAEWSGPYHSWFGRDSAITTDFVCAATEFGGSTRLAKKAHKGLLALAEWQGTRYHAPTGEKPGKIPHEIRTDFNDVHEVQHDAYTNQKPWYIDPSDNTLKNWDSADSTPLWVIAVSRSHELHNISYTEKTLKELRAGLEWIITTIEAYDGLLGFTGADLQEDRVYSGLHNQGWKDSFQVYQRGDELAKHPIWDILVNGEAWAALRHGSEIFQQRDHAFAQQLSQTADALYQRFNSKENGFLLEDESYYAQAIDGTNRQLTQKSVDVAACLWAFYQDHSIIESPHIAPVVETITSSAFFAPYAGLRNYALGTEFPQGTKYHGSPYTFWPFMSGMVARGLLHFSYHDEAVRIIHGYLSGVQHFGSNIEMFTETAEQQLCIWSHPEIGQQSAVQQAWTAAVVYYGTLYLLATQHTATKETH